MRTHSLKVNVKNNTISASAWVLAAGFWYRMMLTRASVHLPNS